MPRFRNSSDFRQAVTIAGTRVLMLPNDVIESSSPLTQIWLEQVSDNTPITVTPSRRVASLKNQVEALKTANKDAVITGKEELDSLRQSIEESANSVLENVNEELDKTQRDLKGLFDDYQEFKKTIMRRLEILKGAMMTMQQDFYEIEFDEAGRVIDDTKSDS